MSRTPKLACFICKSPEDDELMLGKFYSKWRIRVHYYCLLLTSNLIQSGDDDDVGIFGFMLKDIKQEEARIHSQKCYVCKQRYANISCCAKKCFRTFHTACGIRAGCLSHFIDTYQSWCDKHVEMDSESDPHSEQELCGICYDEMGPYKKVDSVAAPCCQNGWFHRRCVAQFAQSSGYFFKCPLCNNKDDFSRAMSLRGVFIPEKDAAWELEPNAFSEQLERPTSCDAEQCLCRHGRTHDSEKWDLILCATCGSTCRHDKCMEVPSKNYVCLFCRPIIGDAPPPAVLALAEAARRAEEARRQELANESDSSESYKSCCSDTDNDSEPEVKRRKTKNRRRPSSSSSLSPIVQKQFKLHSLVKKLALDDLACKKLLQLKPVIKLEKLTKDQIKKASTPCEAPPLVEKEEPPSSTCSSPIFDFNYRAQLNKKIRRRSISALRAIQDVIRSDTDTLTEGDCCSVEGDHDMTQAKRAKYTKLKLISDALKRKLSTSESEVVLPTKKACFPTPEKCRKTFIASENSENACPNSPLKTGGGGGSTTGNNVAETQKTAVLQKASGEIIELGGGHKFQQLTLNRFFNKPSESVEVVSPNVDSGCPSKENNNNKDSAISASRKKSGKRSSRKKFAGQTPGKNRKSQIEVDRSQRNLLDYFNRC
ncbi:pineapple eye protein-like isoform X2 [Uranotaenia lowii]|uniref:pineapple eye protein-like isoform X2 n=1 Tax=Uranotaenia lowii TaxID=190385 RepID=UPI0024798285|nr:pineapple eye protein-like isoform X2 [Uranotaenia lowii]XP_055614680.1 pineapple eye protein-like isoform X2 [Uranotaenia lowii]